jgi:hypothetical protein
VPGGFHRQQKPGPEIRHCSGGGGIGIYHFIRGAGRLSRESRDFGPIRTKADEKEKKKMSKKNVKQLSGVLASVFAHAGHITKEEAREISGLAEEEFEETYTRASAIVEKAMAHEGRKMDKFLEHFAKEIDHWTTKYGGKLFD